MKEAQLQPSPTVARTTVALIGNPNSGKSTVFNLLTGTHQTVGNWPGVTVERKSGLFAVDEASVEVVDLPGVYSLGGGGALDEKIARDYVLSDEADLIVNIVDSNNLERQFGLTAELCELGKPVIILLNMADEAEKRGRSVDTEALEAAIGCPALSIVATRARGRAELVEAIERAIEAPRVPRRPGYPEAVERAIDELVRSMGGGSDLCDRIAAVRVLEGTADTSDASAAQAARSRVERSTGETAVDLVADARFGFAERLVSSALRDSGEKRTTPSDRLDRVVLNRFLGLPIFLVMMYLLFVVSFAGGNVFLDFIDRASYALFVLLPGALLEGFHAPAWIVQLVSTAVGGAIRLVLPFMAPVGFTFLFLTILEESGYMARGTFVMERFMRRLGLPGKTLVPMVIGFGCNVPAVMSTRSIENPRDRLLVAMMQPFMSCSARLVIYMAFAAVFFRRDGGQVVFGLYLLGIVTAVLTALLLGKTVLKGHPQPFILDLPPYRVPTARGLAISVWHRLKIYIWRVGRVIATATVCIYLLSSFAVSSNGIRVTSDPGKSILGTAGRAITPLFHPMGIREDNWPATLGLLTGAVAKEIVIGTLNGAYSRERATALPDYRLTELGPELRGAVATIPENAALLVGHVADPLGFGSMRSDRSAAAYSGASQATLRELGANFTLAGALAYLIFVLLYIPCVSTMGAIRRETGSWRWTLYAIAWGVAVAYGLATLFYQTVTFGEHPAGSVVWISGVVVAMALIVRGMALYGRRTTTGGSPDPESIR